MKEDSKKENNFTQTTSFQNFENNENKENVSITTGFQEEKKGEEKKIINLGVFGNLKKRPIQNLNSNEGKANEMKDEHESNLDHENKKLKI